MEVLFRRVSFVQMDKRKPHIKKVSVIGNYMFVVTG